MGSLMSPLLVLFILKIAAVVGTPACFKCVTWNVNSVDKIRSMDHERCFLAGFDVVFLQETYSGTPESAFDLEGFIPHHQLGRPTLRRFQWGLSTFLRINAFVGGSIRRIPCPLDWIVVSRWQRSTDIGLMLINVYYPAHSDGFSVHDSNAALAFIDSLRVDFPGDSFLLGGDLNVDRYISGFCLLSLVFFVFCLFVSLDLTCVFI
jgi:exonuclease III